MWLLIKTGLRSRWFSRSDLIDMGSSSLLHSRGSAASFSHLLRSITAGVFGLPNPITGGKFGARRMTSTISSPLESPPYLMLPPTFEGGNMFYNLYSLADNKIVRRDGGEEEEFSDDIKFVGSSHGWLASFNQRNNDLFLSNPLSGSRIKLPPIDTLPDPKVNLRHGGRGSVSKVIISCSPDESKEECRAMMSFGPGDRLAFCSPGRSTEWAPIGDLFFHKHEGQFRFGRAYEDFVYCSRRRLFSCTTQLELDLGEFKPNFPSELENWDLNDPRSPKSSTCYWLHLLELDAASSPWLFENRDLFKLCRQIPYLVYAEKYDQLFVVIRFVLQGVGCDGPYIKETAYDPLTGGPLDKFTYRTVGFCALRVDYDKKGLLLDEMSLVDDDDGCPLDGLAMFIGSNHSFAKTAAEFPELKPNSIYFTDSNKHYTPDGSVYGGHDIGIFDYQNKTLSPCHYPCKAQSRRKKGPPPFWFTPSSSNW